MPSRLSGQRVRAKMQAAGLTQAQLCAITDLSPATIDRIVNDRGNSYNNYTVQRLADGLGCQAFELFTEDAVACEISEQTNHIVADVVAEAVAEAVTAEAGDVAPQATPEQVAEAVPNIPVSTPPVLDVSSYFAYIQSNHHREMEALEKAHAAENAERDKHLADIRREKNAWRAIAVSLIAIICLWLAWDLTHPNAGIIRYAQSMGLIGFRG